MHPALSGRGKKSERARKKIGREAKNAKKRPALLRVLDFSSPEFFSRLFRLFPPPPSTPGFSEDGENASCYYSSFVFFNYMKMDGRAQRSTNEKLGDCLFSQH